MNTLWYKVWADLWLYKSRTLLAIASVAAGVFCVGTLFGMIDLQLAKMDAAHRQSQPSHINLFLRNDADQALLRRIATVPGVGGVDAMTQLTVRFRLPGETEWRNGTLVVRPDYTAQRFDRTVLQEGVWPEADNIAIENLSAQALAVQPGGSVEFEITGGAKALPVTGVVRHPFVKPPQFGGQAHFFATPTAAARFGIPADSFRQLLVQTAPPYSADRARTVAAEIRGVLAANRIAVNATLLQDPEKHWGRPFFAGINGVLQAMGLAALVLASVLVFNTVSAHIAQQTDQIGVMKALGARTAVIAELYLAETLLVSCAALLVALPAGLAAAYFSSCRLLALFNIDCGGFAYSPRAVACMLGGGSLAPLLAALPPVLRGAAMTVRVAIASYGLGGDFGGKRFDLWVERLGALFLPTLYAAALGNLFRRKGRLLLTQSVLVIAGTTFLVLMALAASVNLTLDNEMARSRYAVRLGFGSDQAERQVIALAKAVVGTRSVEIWQRLPLEMAQGGKPLRQKGSLGAQLLAVPPDTPMYRPFIEAGRWLQAADAGRRVVVLGADTAALNGIEVGDFLDIRLGANSQAWQVVGLYRWLAGNNYAVEAVYAPLQSVQEISQARGVASFALLDADVTDPSREAAYLQALQRRFQSAGIALDVYTTQAKLEQRQFARNQFRPVIATLLGLAAMLAVVGGIGLSGTLAIGVLQRIREIGVMRAIGAPSPAIFRLFMLEGLLHGMVAWALTVPLAYFAAPFLSGQLGQAMLGIRLDYAFDWQAIGYWLGITVTLACAASYWPARKATRLTVRECLGP